MNINGTINTMSGNWKDIKKHVNRDYKHSDNEQSIDRKATKYNLMGEACSVKWVLHRHYGKWLHARNQKMKKQRRFSRIKTFDEFIKGKRGKKVTNRQTMTFGTIKDKRLQLSMIKNAYPSLSSGQVKRRYFRAVSYGLKRYAIHYNKRNKYVPMGHWETNVDEAGAPHLHCEVIPLGATKKGKPSSRLSSALKAQFHEKSRTKAMSDWSRQEDNALVRDVGATLAMRFQNVPDFKKWKLQHTHKPQHQNEVEYKFSEDKKRLSRERKQLDQGRKEFEARKKRAEKQIKKHRQRSERRSKNYAKELRDENRANAKHAKNRERNREKREDKREQREDKREELVDQKNHDADRKLSKAEACMKTVKGVVKSFENRFSRGFRVYKANIKNMLNHALKQGFEQAEDTSKRIQTKIDSEDTSSVSSVAGSMVMSSTASSASRAMTSKASSASSSDKPKSLYIRRPSLYKGSEADESTRVKRFKRLEDWANGGPTP